MERVNTKNSEDEDEEFGTECGIGYCKKISWLQRLANKTVYVIVYGVLGCIFSASYAYSNSTISTIEKRYKIPSKVTGKSLIKMTVFCYILLKCDS